MDNRGNRLLAVDDSGINTPAIAAAHAVKRYNAQAADEISLQVRHTHTWQSQSQSHVSSSLE
jgi:hypothetical protein